MKNWLRMALVLAVAFFFASNFLTRSSAQRGMKLFSHLTPAHREKEFGACKTCHVITVDWEKRPRPDKKEPFPDITNFPFVLPGAKQDAKRATSFARHTACFGCHSNDGFKNGGVFCQVCHIDPGFLARPGRGMRQFPVSSRPTQFVTVFPHDAHQDILASNSTKQDVALGHFVFAGFSRAADKKKPEYYNCAICHRSAQTLPKFTARAPLTDQIPPAAAPDSFKPAAEFFKDVPMDHSSCFSCHYQRIQPISTNCAGCHKLAEKPYARSTVVARFSLKFDHDAADKDGKPVHGQDCATCHLSVAGSSDLQALKNKKEPEVPYSSCSNCHEAVLNRDLENRKANKAYQCGYCHTTAVGRYDVPAGHK